MRKVKILVLIAIVVPMTLLLSADANARNADLSRWLKNLSGTSTATGSESYSNWPPEIVVSGNTVHVVWVHQTPDQSAKELHYRRSLDKGKTWEDKKVLSSHGGYAFDGPSGCDTYRRMAVSGNNVHIFQDYGNNLLRYFRSTDGGATFEMREFPLQGVRDIYVSASGNKITVGYYTMYLKSSGYWGARINVMTSEDNGLTFTEHIVATLEGADVWLEDMQVSGNKIFMLYRYNYGYPGGGYDYGTKAYLSASTDRGQSFVTNEISVPSAKKDDNGVGVHKTARLQDAHYVPKIAIDGTNVYVVLCGLDFEDTRSLFFRRSTNNGTSFENAVNLTKTTITGRDPRWGSETVVAKAGKVYVLFISAGHGYSWDANGDTAVEFMRSLDKGASFEPPKRLNNSGNEGHSYDFTRGGWWPLIKLDPFDSTGSKIHVIIGAMSYSYSSDSGANFKGPVRLDAFRNSSLGRTQMAIGSDGAVHIVSLGGISWYSPGVFGDSDIFYRIYNPFVPKKAPIGNKALSILEKSNLGDGTGDERCDMMQIPASSDINFTDSMTIEGWIKPNRQDGYEAYFVTKLDPGAEGSWVSYMLGQWSTGSADARISTTSGGYVIVGGHSLPNNKWSHLAMTYNANGGANNFRLYVNGNLVASTTATGTLLSNKKGPLVIGSQYGYSSDTLKGVVIDELRLWNRALSPEEIKANMRKTLTGTEAGLVAYFPFNELITIYGTIRDVTERGNDGTLMYKESLTTGVEFILKLLSPNSGIIPAGSVYNIKWQAPTKAVKFKLYYSTDNKQTWNYITEVGNVREYNWQVPAQDERKPQSFVKLEAFDSLNNKIGEDVSDKAFVINVLRLTSPDGGETLTVGNTHTITWETYSLTKTVEKVIVQYSSNGGQTWTNIKTFVGTNPGQINWTVPNTPSTNCMVKVTLKDSAGATIAVDTSNKVFTIQ